MTDLKNYYPDCPEAYIVGLARSGDSKAFEEIVRRKQSMIRNLMRRCSRDQNLADDLAQQVFLKVWLSIRTLRDVNAFNGWLKKLAVSVWLQHLRKHDVLENTDDWDEVNLGSAQSSSEGMDLDAALGILPGHVRLCIVLSYNEGFTHQEIASATGYPLGTVKSHINRGTARLREALAAYDTSASSSSEGAKASCLKAGKVRVEEENTND